MTNLGDIAKSQTADQEVPAVYLHFLKMYENII